jgi:hypothetical protein
VKLGLKFEMFSLKPRPRLKRFLKYQPINSIPSTLSDLEAEAFRQPRKKRWGGHEMDSARAGSSRLFVAGRG